MNAWNIQGVVFLQNHIRDCAIKYGPDVQWNYLKGEILFFAMKYCPVGECIPGQAVSLGDKLRDSGNIVAELVYSRPVDSTAYLQFVFVTV